MTIPEKVSEIRRQKDLYIKPENIKRGTTILGVEGELTEGVKLFNNTVQMQADTTAELGDLAVVYRQDISRMSASSVTSSIIFPEKVTLPSKVTSSSYVFFESNSSSWVDCRAQLSATYFSFDMYSDLGSTFIEYSSEDGINYTRTTSVINPVEFGCEIFCYYEEEWSEDIGYFMLINQSVFEGLYTYTNAMSEYKACKMSTIQIVDSKLTPSTDYIIVDKDKTDSLVSKCIQYVEEEFGKRFDSGDAATIMLKDANTLVILSAEGSTSYSNQMRRVPLYVNSSKILGLVPNDDQPYVMEYQFSLNDGSFISNVSRNFTETLESETGTTFYNSYYLLSYGTTGYILQSDMYCYGLNTRLGNCYEYTRPQYIIAPSQLSLQNTYELLPEVSGYGKKGLIEGDGSIWDHIGVYNAFDLFTGTDPRYLGTLHSLANNPKTIEKGYHQVTNGDDYLVKTKFIPGASVASATQAITNLRTIAYINSSSKFFVQDIVSGEILYTESVSGKTFSLQVSSTLAYFLIYTSSGGVKIYKLENDEYTLIIDTTISDVSQYSNTRLAWANNHLYLLSAPDSGLSVHELVDGKLTFRTRYSCSHYVWKNVVVYNLESEIFWVSLSTEKNKTNYVVRINATTNEINTYSFSSPSVCGGGNCQLYYYISPTDKPLIVWQKSYSDKTYHIYTLNSTSASRVETTSGFTFATQKKYDILDPNTYILSTSIGIDKYNTYNAKLGKTVLNLTLKHTIGTLSITPSSLYCKYRIAPYAHYDRFEMMSLCDLQYSPCTAGALALTSIEPGKTIDTSTKKSSSLIYMSPQTVIQLGDTGYEEEIKQAEETIENILS